MKEIEPSIWENADGWYYSDEDNRMHGPFSTKEEAKEKFQQYVRLMYDNFR